MRPYLLLLIVLVLLISRLPVRAQESVFPLPADLYILTSERQLIRVDAANGGQTVISSNEQPIFDFDIAPDGQWYAYRTSLNNALIVSSLDTNSGYVAEFDTPLPPDLASGQTLAWSPDTSALAYLVPDGVRISRLSAGEFGEPLFDTIQGTGWTDLYWTDPNTLVVRGGDQASQLVWQNGEWTQQAIDNLPERSEPNVSSTLTPEGVTLIDGMAIPGTAGALAFDWGVVPPPEVNATTLPHNLYFIAPDEQGIEQVWVLSIEGEPARAITTEEATVNDYALSPTQEEIVYTTGEQVIAAQLDGSNRREIGKIDPNSGLANLDWFEDQIVYDDSQGIWIVPDDGSQPPRLLLQNQSEGEPRYYFSPQWSPDGTQLLVGIGFYEAGILGVLNLTDGSITELSGMTTMWGQWTNEGQVITWGSAWGYTTPGLYLYDLTVPTDPPASLLDTSHPVLDVTQTAEGQWYVLVGSTTNMGPQFLHVLTADSMNGPFVPVSEHGGFAETPQLDVLEQTGAVMVAGLHSIEQDSRGRISGELVIMDMITGMIVRVQTPGPVSSLQWDK